MKYLVIIGIVLAIFVASLSIIAIVGIFYDEDYLEKNMFLEEQLANKSLQTEQLQKQLDQKTYEYDNLRELMGYTIKNKELPNIPRTTPNSNS